MTYPETPIAGAQIPPAKDPIFQHLLDTYASETNKVFSVWTSFRGEDLKFRLHEKSSTVGEIMQHQLLSERRFFAEFLGTPEAPASDILPSSNTPESHSLRRRRGWCSPSTCPVATSSALNSVLVPWRLPQCLNPFSALPFGSCRQPCAHCSTWIRFGVSATESVVGHHMPFLANFCHEEEDRRIDQLKFNYE